MDYSCTFRMPRERDYETEKQKRKSKAVPTEEHPLRGTIVTVLCFVSWNYRLNMLVIMDYHIGLSC